MSEETKEIETQKELAKTTAVQKGGYIDPLHIPPEDVPFGYELGWVRYSFTGLEDRLNLYEARDKGWMPICAKSFSFLTVNRTVVQNSITHRGLLLAIRPLIRTINIQAEPLLDKNPDSSGLKLLSVQNPRHPVS